MIFKASATLDVPSGRFPGWASTTPPARSPEEESKNKTSAQSPPPLEQKKSRFLAFVLPLNDVCAAAAATVSFKVKTFDEIFKRNRDRLLPASTCEFAREGVCVRLQIIPLQNWFTLRGPPRSRFLQYFAKTARLPDWDWKKIRSWQHFSILTAVNFDRCFQRGHGGFKRSKQLIWQPGRGDAAVGVKFDRSCQFVAAHTPTQTCPGPGRV